MSAMKRRQQPTLLNRRSYPPKRPRVRRSASIISPESVGTLHGKERVVLEAASDLKVIVVEHGVWFVLLSTC